MSLSTDAIFSLIDAAKTAALQAYAPYSRFYVGCALHTASGRIITGVNIENAAYPQSQCAEATALGTWQTQNRETITAIAVMTSSTQTACWPCGGCRQRLAEFASDDTPVYTLDADGKLQSRTIAQLLPDSFNRTALS